MIKYLKNSEIDKELWDRKIAASPQGEVYAFSWFLDIVSPGWDALVSESYSSLFPLTKRKKFGFDYLFQPYFTQQLGLFSSKELTEVDTRNFIDAIPDKFRLIEINLNAGNRISSAEGFEIAPRKTHLLDLSPDILKLRSGFSENLRRNLKKARESEFTRQDECTLKEIISLFRSNKGRSIDNLKDNDYEVFERLMKAGEERNLVELRCLRDKENILLAGALFLKSVNSWIFLFSATSDEGKKSGAMSSIIDGFVENHSGEKKVLDFEGSMDENLARYYKSFGSKEVVYLQVRKNKLPSLIRWLK